MAAIKSRGNKSTEERFLKLLKEKHITGWRRNNMKVTGRPDFIFPNKKLAIFLDGCFWHGCPICYKEPKSNIKFWVGKIKNNRRRDKVVSRKLRSTGWDVLRVWEHELKNSNHDWVLIKLKKYLI